MRPDQRASRVLPVESAGHGLMGAAASCEQFRRVELVRAKSFAATFCAHVTTILRTVPAHEKPQCSVTSLRRTELLLTSHLAGSQPSGTRFKPPCRADSPSFAHGRDFFLYLDFEAPTAHQLTHALHPPIFVPGIARGIHHQHLTVTILAAGLSKDRNP
jgi:hypothetical protein